MSLSLLLMSVGQNVPVNIPPVIPSGAIGTWVLNDPSGSVAADTSGAGRNAAIVGSPSLASINAPGNINVMAFDGVDDRVNLYSASLAGAFSGAEGSLLIWVKIGAAEWIDGVQRQILYLSVDTNNRVQMYKTATNNQLAISYKAGGVTQGLTLNNINPTDWTSLIITWSKSNNRVNMYLNGARINLALTGLGTFAGSLGSTQTNLGSLLTGTLYKGAAAYASLYAKEITLSEIIAYATPMKRKTISIIGDSISAMGDITWPYKLPWRYPYGTILIKNHAVSGATVMADLANQVTAAADDGASDVIIHLGTNDNNAGDMSALQSTFEAAIIALKASNIGANIICMGVLKRWTTVGGTVEVDKSNIRAAEIAASVAQNAAYWDTYNPSWRSAAQTSDGLHPINSGMDAIVDNVFARY